MVDGKWVFVSGTTGWNDRLDEVRGEAVATPRAQALLLGNEPGTADAAKELGVRDLALTQILFIVGLSEYAVALE